MKKRLFITFLLVFAFVMVTNADEACYNVWLPKNVETVTAAMVNTVRQYTGLATMAAKKRLQKEAPCWMFDVKTTREKAEGLAAALKEQGVDVKAYLFVDENNFPDENFRKSLSGMQTSPDGKNTCMLLDSILHVTTLDLHSKDINTLKGIEYFTNLEILYCQKNKLTSIDLSGNEKLTTLFCYGNNIDHSGMDAIIANLPATSSGGLLPEEEEGQGLIDDAQVKAAMQKGWTILRRNSDGLYTLYNNQRKYYAFRYNKWLPYDSMSYYDRNGGYYGPTIEIENHSGAFYTGNYTSPFKTYLGKTDEEVQAKLDQLWNHYFKGDSNSKVYYDKGTEAYIKDIANNDVRSEGMSYGMMIAVQTDHREEFDKLWNWAKNHMWHKGGDWDGYFAWQRNESGTGGDDNCAPDGEMYFMTSLIFAAHRWGDNKYMEDAQYILEKMWNNPRHCLFNPSHYVITFQPLGGGNDFSDPSYDLPAFIELFSRWSDTNQDKWEKAVKGTRNHLYKSSNTSSGLFADYSNFDGTPHSYSYNSNAEKYMYDAMRCAMNFGMDYYLFGADATRQEEMAKRLIDFFEKDNYTHARFNWDGSSPSEQYTQGETGANAVACYCLMNDDSYQEIVRKNLQMAWDVTPMTGQYRYYDGIVHYLSMLHLCGSFKIWKKSPLDMLFVLGDVNGDGNITMADANAVVNYFLADDKSGITNFNVDAANVNGDDGITMADANAIVNMFLGQ